MSDYVGGTYEDVAFDVPDHEDGMEILWSEVKPDGTAAIMRDENVWWLCVNGQAIELTEAQALDLGQAVSCGGSES